MEESAMSLAETITQTEAKLRPALLLRQLPGQYNNWLICMISSQHFRANDGM